MKLIAKRENYSVWDTGKAKGRYLIQNGNEKIMEKDTKKDAISFLQNKRIKNRFEIDFFEFVFLVEACIPPAPIARSIFWSKVIDSYYFELTKQERDHLFDWIGRSTHFQKGIEAGNEDCLLFKARYDPKNQYLVKTDQGNFETFMFKGKCHTKANTSILEDYILEIKKINNDASE